ncbi:hypothetical protein K3495_g6233 [Podosphaera aphanis]|nr:hypothetical protein K3495_g6233 [Podosphaera aphanis]
MPETISYPTRQGTVFYTPQNPSRDTEPPRLPSPPCRPRPRRPHSIVITRLPTLGSKRLAKSTSNKRPNLRNIKPCQAAKRAFISLYERARSKPSDTSLFSTPHTFSYSKKPDNHKFIGYSPSNFPGMSPRSPNFAGFHSAEEGRRGSRCNMLRIPSVDNSWIPVIGNDLRVSRNNVGAASLRSSSASNSHGIPSSGDLPESEKPLASGNGLSCSITMAEPVIFLMGLDNDGTTRESHGGNATALLRGTLRLSVTKNTKIKAIRLKFTGRAKTLWPEGIPPLKQETVEVNSLRTQVLPFFNALHEASSSGFGDLCTYTLRDRKASVSSSSNLTHDVPTLPQQSSFSFSGITSKSARNSTILHVAEGRRFSVPSLQLKHTQRGDISSTSTQPKGYKVFTPGIYDYSFELPIDNNMPETTNLPLASVKWELEATIERAGTFKANLVGKKEVPVIRLPSQDSLELVEPIAVSRTWDQKLHYDIVISGKSFPIGTKIPIAFKLTPLAKIQVHKVKVFLSENIDYYAKDRSVQRKDTKRNMLLIEKSAGKPIAKEFWRSEVKIIGGERTMEECELRRTQAMRRREIEAERDHSLPVPLPDHVNNLLGDIDLGVEEWCSPTEIEMNVQLPTCEAMEKDRSKRLAHDCTWRNVQVNHWLKILIRLSRADTNDPSKRRHYEISVDSPISLLSCRASLANISLPEYSGLNRDTLNTHQVCGCINTAPSNETLLSPESALLDSHCDFPPRFDRSMLPPVLRNSTAPEARPVHLMRSPSFLPPPFDAEEPPPPIETPPPLYDNVFGNQAQDGLADYFERLGEYEDELTDVEELMDPTRNGSLILPNSRTREVRTARSMELNRNFMFNTTATNSIIASIDPMASES